MVFSSIEFLLKFFPVFLFLYYLTPNKFKNITLMAGSFWFYASCGLGNLILLVVMTLIDYGAGRWIGDIEQLNSGKRRLKKAVLIGAVCVNLGVLLWYKRMPGQVLPVGLSFYTFQSLSYLLDVYRGEIKAETSLIQYGAYISMFPQLSSGPIVYYSEVEADLRKHCPSMRLFDEGAKQFVMGLIFKVLLADRIALLWNEIQTTGFVSISTPLAWMGAYAYSMQIYFDFSGYSLMAVGLGKMLGFHLPENFALPYGATSVRDFYRRWHMTLGRWFCKYVYIPLGGNRKGLLRTVLNLLAVWVLTALWHGDTENFLIWGLLLWAFISLEKMTAALTGRKHSRERGKGGDTGQNGKGGRGSRAASALGHLYVWLVLPITWVCFAIPETDQLLIYFGRMTGRLQGISVYGGDFVKALQNYGVVLAVCVFMCTPLSKKIYDKYKDSFTGMALLAILFWYCVYRILIEGNNPFMYLHF